MAKPYESLIRFSFQCEENKGSQFGEEGQRIRDAGGNELIDGTDESNAESLVVRLAYKLWASHDDKRSDHGRGFIPFWYEPLKLAEKYHSADAGGVDFTCWHWTLWAQMLHRAEGMSYDDKAFQSLDRATVAHPIVSEEKRNRRLALLEEHGRKL